MTPARASTLSLVKPEEYVQDSIALDLSSKLSWHGLSVEEAASQMRRLTPTNRAAVAQKMIVNGTEPAVANAILAMSFGMKGLGQATDQGPSTAMTLFGIAGFVSTAALAYHGYRRDKSVGWALVWGLLGGIFWPIAVPIALAQGFGEPKR